MRDAFALIVKAAILAIIVVNVIDALGILEYVFWLGVAVMAICVILVIDYMLRIK